MGVRIGICGTGVFADSFIPLFNAHPAVSEVILCDLDGKKLKTKADRFGIDSTCPSLDELCQTDVDAIAIFTQHNIHGPQAAQALESGKHVYSAVPAAITMEEVTKLVETVQQTGKIYMIGETSYYYPCTIYCRDRFRKGDFGHIVFSEAEYHHDYTHGGYDVMKWRFGREWKKYFGMPPLFYPTHSVSMVVSVTGAHATHLSGMGFTDRHEDNLYGQPDNVWNNPYSNETILCKMSDGSTARFNEFRRIGHPGTVGMSMYGTESSYEEQVGSQMWVTKDKNTCIDLREQLACSPAPSGKTWDKMSRVTSEDGTHLGISPIHPVERLPKEFAGLPNSHKGSHQFLVDDFVTACETGLRPPNSVWEAARYLVPGLIGHQSVLRGGELMEVPDFGDPGSGSSV